MKISDFVNLNAPAAQPWHVRNCARALVCETAALRAVMQVECRGHGFDRYGRPVMLFEPHVFYRCLSGEKRRAAVAAGLAYPRWRKNYGEDPYVRIGRAMRIDEEAALRGASWGLPQILGENHREAGFGSAREMVEAFVDSEVIHLNAMVAFLKANHLDAALARKDWVAFARGYNGPRYAENAYDVELAKAYRLFAADDDYGEAAPARPEPIPSMGREQAAPPRSIFERLFGWRAA